VGGSECTCGENRGGEAKGSLQPTDAECDRENKEAGGEEHDSRGKGGGRMGPMAEKATAKMNWYKGEVGDLSC